MISSNNKLIEHLPKNFDSLKNYDVLILNDGDYYDKFNLANDNLITIGVIVNERLDSYTPWASPSLKENGKDFGGLCDEYNRWLENELVPYIKAKFKVNRLIYGGYSLGGLAALYSLYKIDLFDVVFSVCGSCWYPGFKEFTENNQPLNSSTQVFMLNGIIEGINHGNILENAFENSYIVIKNIIQKNKKFKVIFDQYGHHAKVHERFMKVYEWINETKKETRI